MFLQKKLNFLLVLIMTVLWIGCGPCDGNCGKDCCKKMAQSAELKENPKEWQPLYDEVMRVHDEVMPEIGRINKLKQDLERYSVKYHEKVDAKQAKIIAGLTKALENADKGMWDWMHEFKQPEGDAALEVVNPYLQAELEKITAVSALMKNSMNDAKNFLDANDFY